MKHTKIIVIIMAVAFALALATTQNSYADEEYRQLSLDVVDKNGKVLDKDNMGDNVPMYSDGFRYLKIEKRAPGGAYISVPEVSNYYTHTDLKTGWSYDEDAQLITLDGAALWEAYKTEAHEGEILLIEVRVSLMNENNEGIASAVQWLELTEPDFRLYRTFPFESESYEQYVGRRLKWPVEDTYYIAELNSEYPYGEFREAKLDKIEILEQIPDEDGNTVATVERKGNYWQIDIVGLGYVTLGLTYTDPVGNKAGENLTMHVIPGKMANTLVAKGKTIKLKAKKVKKKKQIITAKKAFSVNGNKGKVTYKKASGNKKITVAKNGKITVKKGLKKGTYKVKVKVTAAGDMYHNPATRTVSVKIKVK